MDWKIIAQTFEDLDKSFDLLEAEFLKAKNAYKHKQQVIMNTIGQIQKNEAMNLAQILNSLNKMTESINSLQNK